MTAAPPREDLATHRVGNRVPPLAGHDPYARDAALREAVRRVAGGWLDARMRALSARVGAAEVRDWGTEANARPPEARIFDRTGARLDEVAYPAAYHRLMALAMEHRIHDIAWAPEGPAPHAGHAAMLALFTQAEAGVMCPVNMTYAAVPALRADPAGRPWADRIVGGRYDPELRPAAEKPGVTFGMAMTEKQGGSDVRANETRAEPDGESVRLTGHKWFCSAPMSDAFLTLAQGPEGLTCYVVPRVLPDGTRNRIQLMRLKDKLGNRSNASAEIEYHGALAQPVGTPGRGVNTIIAMVHHTRLGTASATLGVMRAALAEAVHHVRHRSAFQRRLIDQPLMRRVLADLQVEYEAAAALVLHVAESFGDETPEGRAYARLIVALAKYLLTKRCAGFVHECMECLGGAGYIEEHPMPRLYREAPVNGIWEGSGNVIALDILRTLARAPQAGEALVAALSARHGAAAAEARALLARGDVAEGDARHVAERLALCLQAALLAERAPEPVAQAFAAILGGAPRTHGAGERAPDVDALLARAWAEG